MAKPALQRNNDLQVLRAENERLRADNKQLQQAIKSNPGNNKKDKRIWHKLGIILSISIAGALLVAGNALFWTGRTLVDTDQFVATVDPLIKDPVIQDGLASYTTTQLFKDLDTEQIIQDALPPKAVFLAPTLSDRVEQASKNSMQKLLANEKFETLWTNTLTKGHDKVVNYAKTYEGNGTISLQDIYQNLTNDLQGTKLAFLADKKLPATAGSITVINADWLPTAHNIVNNLTLYRWLAVILLIIMCFIAVWLARNRRKMAIILGIIFSTLMFITLVAIRLWQRAFPDSIDPAYREAVSQAGKIITQPLIVQSRTILVLGLLIAFVAWIGGSYRSATATRRFFQRVFEGRVHSALFVHGENGLSLWFGRHKRVLQWTSVVLVGLLLLIVQLSPQTLITYSLILLFIIMVIELMAAPNLNSE